MPQYAARTLLRMWGIWVEDQTVKPSLSGSGLATTPRVSIALGNTRCCTYRSLTVTSASAKASSMLPVASSHV